jgi:hypothetical protein
MFEHDIYKEPQQLLSTLKLSRTTKTSPTLNLKAMINGTLRNKIKISICLEALNVHLIQNGAK